MTTADEKMYELLIKLGLREEEIEGIYKENTNLKYVLPSDVYQILVYLEKQGLKVKEIIEMAIKNPWVLTESFERIDYLEKYYKEIEIEGESYRELLKKWPESISQNPYEVKQQIEKQKNEGKTLEEIREDFFKNFDKYFEK